MVFKIKKYALISFLSITLFFSCSGTGISEANNQPILDDTKDADFSVLFVGNSLTYFNNLPILLKKHAKIRGLNVEVEMLAKPNYAIIDHWIDGVVQKLIRTKKYDFVVIQQGPSSQANGLEMLITDGAKYAEICEKNSAKLAYFMVWPSLAYYHSFDGVIANYTTGAEANNAILCPVGKIWKDHFDKTKDYSFYGADQFHPSVKGSQNAAEIILDELLKHL